MVGRDGTYVVTCGGGGGVGCGDLRRRLLLLGWGGDFGGAAAVIFGFGVAAGAAAFAATGFEDCMGEKNVRLRSTITALQNSG